MAARQSWAPGAAGAMALRAVGAMAPRAVWSQAADVVAARPERYSDFSIAPTTDLRLACLRS